MKIWYALVTDFNGENKRHYLAFDRATLPDKANYTSTITISDLELLKSWLDNAVSHARETREFMSINVPCVMDIIISY